MRINGNQVTRDEIGDCRVTIDRRSYIVVGGGREWVLSECDGTFRRHISRHTTRTAALRELAMRTYR
jgi:hypothetical protein